MDYQLQLLEKAYRSVPDDGSREHPERTDVNRARERAGLKPYPRIFKFNEGWQAQTYFMDESCISSATVSHDGWVGIQHMFIAYPSPRAPEFIEIGEHRSANLNDDYYPSQYQERYWELVPTRGQVVRAHELIVDAYFRGSFEVKTRVGYPGAVVVWSPHPEYSWWGFSAL